MKYRETIVAMLVLVAVYGTIAHCTGCGPGLIPKEEAAAGYEAQQMACVDKYAIRGDIDRCRARVKAAWATVPDAGGDASEGGAK